MSARSRSVIRCATRLTSRFSETDKVHGSAISSVVARLGPAQTSRQDLSSNPGSCCWGPHSDVVARPDGTHSPLDRGEEVEIRPVFEAEDFGPELTPEMRERGQLIRAQIDARRR